MVGLPTSDYPRIYTAGAMRWEDSEDSWWRRSVEESLSDITFYHPEDTYFDHGGDFVQGAVSEDIQAINAADGVVAYFSETPQIGTLVETLHAVQTDTPTLVLMDNDLLKGSEGIQEYDPSLPPEAKQPKSPKSIGSVEFRASAPDHWFLINYLNGDSKNLAYKRIPDWMSQWDGQPRGTVMAVKDEESIRDAVVEWANEEFGIELE